METATLCLELSINLYDDRGLTESQNSNMCTGDDL